MSEYDRLSRYTRPACLTIFILLMWGCDIPTIDYADYECGKIWGSQRFVKHGDFDDGYLAASKRGYMYALAGALVLQTNDREGREHFLPAVERLTPLAHSHVIDSDTGFEAITFELREQGNKNRVQEIVIAFAGSNDPADWIQNFSPLSTDQYDQAIEYVKKHMAGNKYPGLRLIVTGHSLGAALAIHVTKNKATAQYVHEAWVFNPSPKTHANGKTDKRIMLAAHSGEALAILRWPVFRILPGVSAIGASPEHTFDNYYLVQTNPVYGHYRWVLPMQMLHIADYAIRREFADQNQSTEPLEILQRSSFSGAKPCH